MPVNLEIVSPERLLLSRPVDMVVIPASAKATWACWRATRPMIVMLRGGMIALYEGEQITDQMYVAGGFAEVGFRHSRIARRMPLRRLRTWSWLAA